MSAFPTSRISATTCSTPHGPCGRCARQPEFSCALRALTLVLPTPLPFQRLFDRLNQHEQRISEVCAVHRALRERVSVLRKQRVAMYKRLRTLELHTGSLASDLRYVCGVVHTDLDTTVKADAKIDRAFDEFAWETDHHRRQVEAATKLAEDLEAKLAERTERDAAAKEDSLSSQWARVRKARQEAQRLEGRHGYLQSYSAYLRSKLGRLSGIADIRGDGTPDVRAEGPHSRGARPWCSPRPCCASQNAVTAGLIAHFHHGETRNMSLWHVTLERAATVKSLEAEVDALRKEEAALEEQEAARELSTAQMEDGRLAQQMMGGSQEDLEVRRNPVPPGRRHMRDDAAPHSSVFLPAAGTRARAHARRRTDGRTCGPVGGPR